MGYVHELDRFLGLGPVPGSLDDYLSRMPGGGTEPHPDTVPGVNDDLDLWIADVGLGAIVNEYGDTFGDVVGAAETVEGMVADVVGSVAIIGTETAVVDGRTERLTDSPVPAAAGARAVAAVRGSIMPLAYAAGLNGFEGRNIAIDPDALRAYADKNGLDDNGVVAADKTNQMVKMLT